MDKLGFILGSSLGNSICCGLGGSLGFLLKDILRVSLGDSPGGSHENIFGSTHGYIPGDNHGVSLGDRLGGSLQESLQGRLGRNMREKVGQS